MTTMTPSISVDRSHSSQSFGPDQAFASIRAFLALLWIDIRRSQGYWLLPLMVALGIYAPPHDHLPEMVIWPEMSHATLQSYVVVAPLAAALASWLIDRDRRRRMRALANSLPGSGLGRDLLALGAASFWGLAGYAGVAAWFCGQALLRATWGGPDLGLIGTGALAVVVFAAVGALVGRVVPSKFSPLLALALTFVLTIGADLFQTTYEDGSFRNPIQLLMPFGLTRVTDANVFYRENDGFAGPVAVWMLALLGVAIAVLALLRAPGVRTWLALAGIVLVAAVAAQPLITPDLATGPQAWRAISYMPVCQQRDGFEVCLHPAYALQLDATAADVATTFAPVRGLRGVPTRWSQLDPTRGNNSEQPGIIDGVGYEYGMLGSVAGLFPPADDERFGQRPASQLVVMEWLVEQSGMGLPGSNWFGWPSELAVVEQDYGDGMSGFEPNDADIVAFQPGMDAARERFAALSPGEQRAWLEANWEALRAGELTLKDLP